MKHPYVFYFGISTHKNFCIEQIVQEYRLKAIYYYIYLS